MNEIAKMTPKQIEKLAVEIRTFLLEHDMWVDSGLEINFDSTYKAAENLSFILETGYIHLWLDEGTWGRYENIAGDSLNYKDAWKVSLNVIYAF